MITLRFVHVHRVIDATVPQISEVRMLLVRLMQHPLEDREKGLHFKIRKFQGCRRQGPLSEPFSPSNTEKRSRRSYGWGAATDLVRRTRARTSSWTIKTQVREHQDRGRNYRSGRKEESLEKHVYTRHRDQQSDQGKLGRRSRKYVTH